MIKQERKTDKDKTLVGYLMLEFSGGGLDTSQEARHVRKPLQNIRFL